MFTATSFKTFWRETRTGIAYDFQLHTKLRVRKPRLVDAFHLSLDQTRRSSSLCFISIEKKRSVATAVADRRSAHKSAAKQGSMKLNRCSASLPS